MAKSGFQMLGVRDFAGGLNTWARNHELADNEVPACSNVWFRPGSTQKREGYAKANTTTEGAHACYGLYRGYISGTGHTLALFDTTLYTVASGTLTSLLTGCTASEVMDFETWHDLIIFVQPSENPKKWSGTGTPTDLSGLPPNSAYVIQHQNRLWMAGDPLKPSRLSFSDIALPETWGSTSWVDVGKGFDEITGLARTGGDLVVFKRLSTWLLLNASGDPANFQLLQIHSEIGCTSNLSIVEHDGWTYFLSARGVCRLSGAKIQYIGRNAQSYVDDAPSLSGAAGGFWRHYYWLALPGEGASSNTLVLAVDLETITDDNATWTHHDDINAAVFTTFDGATDTGDLYWGSSNAVGFVYQGNTGTDDAGSAFDGSFTTKQYDMGESPVVKAFRKVAIDALSTGANWTAKVVVDGVSLGDAIDLGAPTTSNLWGVMQWGVGEWETPGVLSYGSSLSRSAIGRNIQFVMSHNDDADSGEIQGLYVMWSPRRVRF